MNETAVIDILHIGILTLHADLDPFGCPDAHPLGLQFRQMDAAGAEGIVIDAFFQNIFLSRKKLLAR